MPRSTEQEHLLPLAGRDRQLGRYARLAAIPTAGWPVAEAMDHRIERVATDAGELLCTSGGRLDQQLRTLASPPLVAAS